jgi:hypothetical protein
MYEVFGTLQRFREMYRGNCLNLATTVINRRDDLFIFKNHVQPEPIVHSHYKIKYNTNKTTWI